MNLKNRHICLELFKKNSNSHLFINDIISNYFYNNNLDEQSKKFINKILLGTIRMQGKYDYILSNIYNGDYKQLKPILKNILRIGCYQIDEMNSIPNHASVSSSVELVKKNLSGYQGLVNALLRKFIEVKNEYILDPDNISTFQTLSHPSWMIDKWLTDFGVKETIKISNYNNQTPEIWFRINNNEKTQFIIESMNTMNINFYFHDINNIFFKTSSPFSIINSSLFKEGFLTIQNPLNGFIVNLLNPKNEDTIIDGCSAPGGKGSFISMLAPRAKIYSIDNNKIRFKKLLNSIARHKITNIKPLILDMISDKLPLANKILIDVPCSGTGVISRRVDLRWKRNLNDIEKSSSIQYNILENSSNFLSKDGVIVYSTCSIEKEENFNVINKFLNKNKNFIIDDASNFVDKRIVKNRAIDVLPGNYNLDGGFAVRLKKL